MDWQLLLVGVLVVFALLYLGRRMLRTWLGQGAGCGNCKHSNTVKKPSAAETLIPLEQLRLRRR